MSADSVYAQLMREMGAPRWDGFNPIAPRSHRWMMDIGQPEVVRIAGWGLWRTIDRDPEGKTGPPKRKRTFFAHDLRGTLGIKHVAEDLGMTLANASDALKRAVDLGYVRIDERGRICPRGDAPEPRRIQSEDEEGEESNVFCTENMPEAIRLSFQSLDKNRRRQYVRRYLGMPKPLSEHFEKLDPDPRAFHTWRYLQAAEYKDQVAADALAAGRATGEEFVDRVCAESGYQDPERRGRPPVSRDLTIELKVRIEPETFFVQKTNGHSVQNGNSLLYKTENGSEQNAYPYAFSSGSQVLQSEVPPTSVEMTAPAARNKEAAPPRPTPKEKSKTPNEVVERNRRAAITATAERLIGKSLRVNDPLREQFPQLAVKFDLPVHSVCQFLEQKVAEQRATAETREGSYPIETLGALYQFALSDLPKWIKKHRTEIEHYRVIEARQRAEEESEPFDPTTFSPEINTPDAREVYQAVLDDPGASEADKRLAAGFLKKLHSRGRGAGGGA